MGLFSSGLKGNILTGLAIGIGASVLAPAVIPVLANVVKPLAKEALKGGIVLYEKGLARYHLCKMQSGFLFLRPEGKKMPKFIERSWSPSLSLSLPVRPG